jgi:hypothetical protein
MLGKNNKNELFPPMLKPHRSLAGFTIQIPTASLTPLTVDGGFYIATKRANSVGILYPGERLDVIVKWNQIPALTSRMNIQLDSEYVFSPRYSVMLINP